MADVNSQVADALSSGWGPQDIINHLSKSEYPEDKEWIANYQSNMKARKLESNTAPVVSTPAGPDVSGVQALGGVANKAAGWYAGLSTPEQIALPVAGVLGTYAAGKAVNLGFNTLQDKLKAAQEVKTQAAINALPPSAAVQVQQGDLALRQAAQAQQFAQQAQQSTGSPAVDPLVEARVATETQRAATEAARTEAAQHQAALAQQKLISQQRKAAITATTPASQVAAAEALGAAAQPTTAAQPSPAQLAELHGLNLASAATSGAVPGVVSGANAPVGEVAPIAPVTTAANTPAEIVADPLAAPVDKAVSLTQEVPKTAPIAETIAPVQGAAVPKVEPSITAPLSVEQKVALLNSRIQPVPPPSEGMIKHMTKEDIAGKLIPYPETRRTPAEMAIAKIETPLNKGYTQIGAASGITPQTPAPEARSFMDRVTNEVFGGKPPSSQGGGAPQVKQITNFIETNQKEFPNIYNKLKDIQARYPTQSGMAHIQMLGGIAGLGLGALGAYGAYKEGKQTGDWTNLGLLGGSLLAGASAPAQAAYQAATYSKSLGETPEELKAFGQMLKNSQQAFKVGAGRGVAPPSAYNR